MQATTCLHDGVPNAVLQEADFIFHDSIAFYSHQSVCSIRMRIDEIRRLLAFSGGVSSPPRGVFFGWETVMPGRKNPWKPLS